MQENESSPRQYSTTHRILGVRKEVSLLRHHRVEERVEVQNKLWDQLIFCVRVGHEDLLVGPDEDKRAVL